MAPTYSTPDWLEGAATREVVDTAKQMMESAAQRVATAEKRSASVFDVSWKLLTLALAATGFEATRLHAVDYSWPWWALLLPNAIAVASLSLASLQGITTSNRVGMGWELELEKIAGAEFPTTAQAVDYWQAAQTIDWTATRKLDDFLVAQSWLSRGIIALIASGIALIWLWVVTL